MSATRGDGFVLNGAFGEPPTYRPVLILEEWWFHTPPLPDAHGKLPCVKSIQRLSPHCSLWTLEGQDMAKTLQRHAREFEKKPAFVKSQHVVQMMVKHPSRSSWISSEPLSHFVGRRVVLDCVTVRLKVCTRGPQAMHLRTTIDRVHIAERLPAGRASHRTHRVSSDSMRMATLRTPTPAVADDPTSPVHIAAFGRAPATPPPSYEYAMEHLSPSYE